jgi:hypothetical protein
MPQTLSNPSAGGALDLERDQPIAGTVDAFKLNVSTPGGSIGYAAGGGVGGTVTQTTSKSTGVTLNAICGQITLNGAALNSSTSVGFTVTDNQVAAADVIVACLQSANTANSYTLSVDAVSAGSFKLSLRNYSGGSLSEAIVVNYAIIKSCTT